MRTFLRQLAEEAARDGVLRGSILIEVMFIAGPMLVAICRFRVPGAAVWFAAACGFARGAAFPRLAALRNGGSTQRRGRTLLGPLAQRSSQC